MKKLDLEAIEQRAAAATPGPWSVVDDEASERQPFTIRAASHEAFKRFGLMGDYRGTIVAFMDCNAYAVKGGESDQVNYNAAFVAAARTDVPALVARVRELEQALEALVAASISTFEDAREYACVHCAEVWPFAMAPQHERGCVVAAAEKTLSGETK